MRVAIPATLFALAASACTLFFPLDGYGPPSGASDASGASGASDAASDSPNAGPFCRGNEHAFCADFDEGALLDGWSSATRADAGDLALSTAQAKSRPLSLLSTILRRSSDGEQSMLNKTFPGPFRRTIVEFDMYFEQADWAADDVNAALFSFYFSSKTGGKDVYLIAAKDYSNFGRVGNAANGAALTTNTWIHAKFDLDPGSQFVADVAGQHYQVTPTPFTAGDQPEMTLSLGVNGFNTPAPTLTAYYDNVTVDFP
jgi:hypothetical protein